MKKRYLAAIILAVGLIAWGLWFGKLVIDTNEVKATWAKTPNVGFNVTFSPPDSKNQCFELVRVYPNDAPTSMTWDQFFLRESSEGGYHDRPFPGASGPLRLGSKTCGFPYDSYYDLIYEPTMYPSWFKYPGCGGNPEGRINGKGESRCYPPADWDYGMRPGRTPP